MTTSTKEDFEKWIEELKEQGKIDEDDDQDEEKFLALAFFGKHDVLKLFKSLGLENFVDSLTFEAVIRGCGNIEFLDWLEENFSSEKCKFEDYSYIPAKQGKHEVLKWMHNHGYKFDETTMTHAVNSGNFELVKWLHEIVGCEIRQDALKEASIFELIDSLIKLKRSKIEQIMGLMKQALVLLEDV